MARSKTTKKLSKKERLAKKNKAARLKQLRIVGLVVLGLVIFAGIFLWRGAGQSADADFRAELPPNLDGPADAPVKIVEFADFGCPACRGWHNAGIGEQLKTQFGDQISFEFRHFPVITAQSPKAAEAGQCAAEQGAFWAYHDYIYEETPQNALAVEQLKSYATAVGLDQAQFASCLDSGKYAAAVRADTAAAREAGARGTPTFLINGRRVTPFYEDMAAAIEAELSN